MHTTPTQQALAPKNDSTPSLVVVEDDEDVADLMTMLLTALGYNTTTANSAEQAISLIEASPDTFDHVRVDLHLPDANGYDLIKALLKLSDGLTFTIISGAETDPEAVADLPVLQSLLKPVSRDDLSQLDIPIRNK